jgi:hypothetical protein
MEKGIDVIMQYITFNPIVSNGIQTFDNMFILVDAEDRLGAGMLYPQIQPQAEVKQDV